MLLVLEFIVRIDQNVIKVGCAEIVEIVEKHIVHVSLVGSRTIGKSKGDYLIFVTSISSPESGEILRSRVYAYTMECLANIEFGEDLCFANSGQGLIE